MARVTVEDCIEKIENRFELVMVASQRARKIGSGSPLTIDRDNDKNPVVSLREVAEETVDLDAIREDIVKGHQRMIAHEDEEDDIDLMDGEKEWGDMAGAAGSEAPSGMYADNDVATDDNAEPSLSDLAGGNPTA